MVLSENYDLGLDSLTTFFIRVETLLKCSMFILIYYFFTDKKFNQYNNLLFNDFFCIYYKWNFSMNLLMTTNMKNEKNAKIEKKISSL